MVSRNLPFEYFVLGNVRREGGAVGHVAGQPISDVVTDLNGNRYRFAGLARRDRYGRLDVDALRAGEWIVYPNLVYASDDGSNS